MNGRLIELLNTVEGRTLLFGKQGKRDYPYEWQVKMLGLAERISQLKGKNVLDIGCGKEANLVYYLRKQGINTEGIDVRAPNDDGFLRQNITNIYPWDGSIMRGDNEYDAIFANSQNTLINALSDQKEASIKIASDSTGDDEFTMMMLEEDLKKMDVHAYATISEILRVLKPGGYFISSPDLNKLEEKMGKQLQGCRIEREPVAFMAKLEKMIKKDSQAIEMIKSFKYNVKGGVFPDFLKKRLVIYKD